MPLAVSSRVGAGGQVDGGEVRPHDPGSWMRHVGREAGGAWAVGVPGRRGAASPQDPPEFEPTPVPGRPRVYRGVEGPRRQLLHRREGGWAQRGQGAGVPLQGSAHTRPFPGGLDEGWPGLNTACAPQDGVGARGGMSDPGCPAPHSRNKGTLGTEHLLMQIPPICIPSPQPICIPSPSGPICLASTVPPVSPRPTRKPRARPRPWGG